MRIFIEPTDVLLFRDGKPFFAGDDHLARSIFPPTPMPFQGALRSAILAKYGFRFSDEVRRLIGDENGYGQLRMKGPFVARRDGSVTEYFPVPTDVVLPKGEVRGKTEGILLKPREPLWKTDQRIPIMNLWAASPGRCETARGFVSETELVRYLLGEVPRVTRETELVCTDLRAGIQRKTSTHSVETGRLYSVAFTRLQSNVGFTVDVNGIQLEPRGLLMLGGESRSARYETISERSWLKEAEGEIKSRTATKPLRFKLYFATPALFKNGWLPRTFKKENLEGELNGIKLKLKAAAVNRPLSIGGWDLKNRVPRPIHRAVPAGSVYYFEAIDPELNVDDLFTRLHFQCISDERREIGFGLTLIGGCNP